MLSVIIPTLNASDDLARLLPQIGSYADDIVVTDGGSSDTTMAVAMSHGARLALGSAGRGAQLARGARWAQCEWLFFVHADSVLPEGWKNYVERHMEKYPHKAGYFNFALNAEGIRPRLMEKMANARTILFALPYGDQGILISRALYDEVGGFPDWPLFEDVALVRKLGRGGLKRIALPIKTSAEKFEKRGYVKSVLANFILFTRYRLGADPVKLYRVYHK